MTFPPPRDPSRDLSLYHPNVGAVLFAPDGRVLIARRAGESAPGVWQFPQGGVDPDEAPADAVLRELEEEIGVGARLLEPLAAIDDWLAYDFPPEVRALKRKGRKWRGQKQRWFAYRFLGSDEDVRLDGHDEIEFDAWRWDALAAAPTLVIPWKRPVYEEVAHAFARFAA